MLTDRQEAMHHAVLSGDAAPVVFDVAAGGVDLIGECG